MQSKLPLLPSGPGGVRKSTVHGPWHGQCAAGAGRLQEKFLERSPASLHFVFRKCTVVASTAHAATRRIGQQVHPTPASQGVAAKTAARPFRLTGNRILAVIADR